MPNCWTSNIHSVVVLTPNSINTWDDDHLFIGFDRFEPGSELTATTFLSAYWLNRIPHFQNEVFCLINEDLWKEVFAGMGWFYIVSERRSWRCIVASTQRGGWTPWFLSYFHLSRILVHFHRVYCRRFLVISQLSSLLGTKIKLVNGWKPCPWSVPVPTEPRCRRFLFIVSQFQKIQHTRVRSSLLH